MVHKDKHRSIFWWKPAESVTLFNFLDLESSAFKKLELEMNRHSWGKLLRKSNFGW